MNHNTNNLPANGAPQSAIMQLISPAFANLGPIPREYTFEGGSYAPPLCWSNLPQGTQSLALTMVDRDIPSPERPLRQFVHWVVYNIPAGVEGLPAAFGPAESEHIGAVTGANGYGRRIYYPPLPVSGAHKYSFTLYALDLPQLDLRRNGYRSLIKAIEGHVLATAELTGSYQCTVLTSRQALIKNLMLGTGWIRIKPGPIPTA